MKAKPVKILPEESDYVACPIEEATHVTLNIPGPTGKLTLPVILKGKREGTGCWSWNGDVENPTLKPSVLSQSGHFAPGFKTEDQCWCKYLAASPDQSPVFKCYRCHSWINDGHAQFLSDCSHELVGQTVPLLEVQ